VLGNEHLDTVRSLEQLAEILYAQKHFDASVRVQQEAVTTLRCALGEDAPVTSAAQRNLERFLGQNG